MKKIWIVILNWNWIDDTIECIDSLKNNSYKDIDIIVVDNNSKNNEWSKISAQYGSDIHFIQNDKNQWFAGWCNIWIEKSLELWNSYTMLFNNDAVAENGFIEKLLAVLDWGKDVWIIWPAITYYKSNKVWFAWWKINYLIWWSIHHLKWKDVSELEWVKPYEIEYMSGCCILIKKEVLEKIWLLDEKYFAYIEEVDFCHRANSIGYKVMLEPNSVIQHKKSASAGNKWSNSLSEIQAYLLARNWVYFWRKNLKWMKKYWYLITQFTILPVLRIIFQIRSPRVLISYIKWLLWLRKEIN